MTYTRQKCNLITLLLLGTSLLWARTESSSTKQFPSEKKGYFLIQFSWNAAFFPEDVRLEIEYKKKGALQKKKNSASSNLGVKKNEFIELELKEGEYELQSIRIYSMKELGYGKFYNLPIATSFIIKSGQVTNGGMFFLTREKRGSTTVLPIKIDNSIDVRTFVDQYLSDDRYGPMRIENAWDFVDNAVLDNIIANYAKSMINAENQNPRRLNGYIRSTLGMIFKIQQEPSGQISDFTLVPTPSYQEIIDLRIMKSGELLAYLANGNFLFGDDNGLDFIKLPKALGRNPSLKVLRNGKILLVGLNGIIFYSNDQNFEWKPTSTNTFGTNKELSLLQQNVGAYEIYQGRKHVFVYINLHDKAFTGLARAPYEDLSQFQAITIPESLASIPGIHETDTHLILGPEEVYPLFKKGASYIHVMDYETGIWSQKELPKSICRVFYPGKDESIWYTECGKGQWYETLDFGTTWKRWKSE